MKRGFSQSIRLMNRLRIPEKFTVLALICVVAVAAVGVSLYRHLNGVIVSSQRELDGLDIIVPIARTTQLLQLHRGLSGGLMGGDESMRETLVGNEAQTVTSFKLIDQSASSLAPISAEWKGIQSDWEVLRKDGASWSASDSFLAHTQLLDKLRSLQRHVGDYRSLSVDPDIDVHYLIGTAVVDLPVALEKLAQIRGLGASILAKKALTSAQSLQVHALMTDLAGARQTLATNLAETAHHNPDVGPQLGAAFKDFDETLPQFLELVGADILNQGFKTSPKEYFDHATKVVDKGYTQMFQTLLPAARNLIHARIVRAKHELLSSAFIAAALLLAALYLGTGIYYSTVDSIKSLATAAQKFASGDVSQRVLLATHDEIAQVGDSFNHMADGFTDLLVARQEDEERLRAIVNSALDAVIQMDSGGRISGWNERAQAIFGWSREEALGRNLHETIIPERYRARHLQGIKHYLASGEGPVLNSRVEVEGLHRAGHEFPIELAISSIKTRRGIEFSAFVRDITERRRTEAELRIAAIAFETDDGIVITDRQGTTLNVNQSYTRITGYSSEEIIGQSPLILKPGQREASEFESMWKSLADDKSWQGEIWSRRKNGEEYPEWIRITAVINESGQVTHYVISFADITQRKKFEQTIHRLAFYDPLTDLPNRRLLIDRLQQRMVTSSRNVLYGALLLIDLDDFKTLNDTRGHDVGDLLLLEVAKRLSTCMREGDTVARLGGDEFVVLLGGLHLEVQEAAAQTETVGRKILAVLGGPYCLGHVEHRSTASVGATLFRGNETSADEIFKQADLAMYKSKEMGRNAFHFFDPEMQTAIVERSALEAGLRAAIVESQLVLHYQAQVAEDGRVMGAEALVRWIHPQRGMISPAEFIPLAEETGLILSLGSWVLDCACRQLAAWASQPDMAHLTLAVNVSAHQFREADFVETVVAAIEKTGACPRHLKLELTESLLVSNVDDIIEKMYTLKAKGVGFSLDDFGTGYSSLSYLKRMPLDQLKIDQSFVRNILIDPNDAAIARTIVALAQSLGLGVIAEGVETGSQRDFLSSAGCHAFQGYFFSRPLPIEGFEKYLQGA